MAAIAGPAITWPVWPWLLRKPQCQLSFILACLKGNVDLLSWLFYLKKKFVPTIVVAWTCETFSTGTQSACFTGLSS